MEAYSGIMVVDEIGLWLERIHHVVNNTRSDSSKIAGCMDLMRVQGRWGPSARLAWVRVVMQSSTDVCGGCQLTKTAPDTFPAHSFWDQWGQFFDKEWLGHINNIIKVYSPSKFEVRKKRTYTLEAAAIKQFETTLYQNLLDDPSLQDELNCKGWPAIKLQSFIHYAVRGFLRGDLYNSLTELLSRAEGSFGIQAHCTIEPGVVVIASKGQPMSISFDPANPIVLFASEAEALAVPVYKSGKWLPERIDLDSHGEIFRMGEPRALQEGNFFDGVRAQKKSKKSKKKKQETPEEIEIAKAKKAPYIMLDCGLEIRAYSLVTCQESTMEQLSNRSVTITSAPIPYDPKVDLVKEDLRVTPAVLSAIDRAWSNPASVERIAGESLANHLVDAMRRRLTTSKDSVDLLIGGVEVSLWIGEHFAADLRRIFPNINIETVSANKMLGIGDDNPSKVFFPCSDELQSRKIDHNTCVLLISQSGQTFATLHATRKMAHLVPGRLWILTGCFHSKMEQALLEGYAEAGLPYERDRVFNNYSGHRPAEPSSVAVAATFHTLTRLLLHTVHVTRRRLPGGRIIHPWDYELFACVIQRFFVSNRAWIKQKTQQMKEARLVEQQKKDSEEDASSSNALVLTKKIHHGGDADVEEDEEGDEGADADHHHDDHDDHGAAAAAGAGGGGEGGALVRKGGVKRGVSIKADLRPGMKQRQSSSKQYKIRMPSSGTSKVVMNLSDGCIDDVKSLLSDNLIPNICQIVGYDHFGQPLRDLNTGEVLEKDTTHAALVAQGKAWADHINEFWHMLVLAGFYILFSVGLGLPIFGLIADAILAIVRAGGAPIPDGVFAFAPRTPHLMYAQPIGYTLIGIFIQFVDAVFFIYLGKNFTRWTRIIHGRPLAARHGKRTIVIVDNPCVHQLTEIFVSKLFSQSYSFVSVDVHGASGMDHFVHRFTHRVVRGVLLAIGRPDGRLGCLAKSEAAVILAAKQAAFICNPDYHCEGSGPEIVTVGHNPFAPNLGLAHNIVLHGGAHQSSLLASVHDSNARELVSQQRNRRKFVDEYIYDRLFLAQKPFTTSILRSLRRAMESGQDIIYARLQNAFNNNNGLTASAHNLSASSHNRRRKNEEPLPYGVHHIDPSILVQSESIESTVFADFIMANRELLKPQILKDGVETLKGKSFDPAVRSAFSARLDSQTRQIQDLQVIVQHFYECRIASLERYMAFCVMFHAMAAHCNKPWLMFPWDIARSQSNLRVATTGKAVFFFLFGFVLLLMD